MGSILASSPSAHLVSPLGWRISFVIIGTLKVLGCTAVFKVVRDGPGTPKGEWLRENVPDKERIILGRLTFFQIYIAAFLR
jgi:predicted MFS family arabinose efflux permease